MTPTSFDTRMGEKISNLATRDKALFLRQIEAKLTFQETFGDNDLDITERTSFRVGDPRVSNHAYCIRRGKVHYLVNLREASVVLFKYSNTRKCKAFSLLLLLYMLQIYVYYSVDMNGVISLVNSLKENFCITKHFKVISM